MTPFDLPIWIVLTFLFLFGCCIGSFLNVCVYRFPQHDSLFDQLKGINFPPSCCPKCQQRISPRDNIPILGWLMLRGKCRNCGMSISSRYPIIEFVNGALFVILYLLEVPTGYRETIEDSFLYTPLGPQMVEGWSVELHVNLRYLYHLVLIEALLVASLIDWDLKIIPDGSTVPAMFVGVTVAVVVGHVHLVPVWFQDPSLSRIVMSLLPESWGWLQSDFEVPGWITTSPHLHGLAVSLVGFLVGGGMIWGVRLIGKWVLRREAMGFGDVVLMAMIGSFLGWQPVVMIFFLAPLCALCGVVISVVSLKQREIPYGPYISIATLIVVMFFRQLWPFWERIFSMGLVVPIMGIIGALLLAISLYGIQLVKLCLGIPLYYPEEYEEWTSADQLGYLYSENQDRWQGRWRQTTADWPGIDSGQGSLTSDQWRHPPASDWKTTRQRHGPQDGLR